MSKKTIIIGLGNPILSDDSVGIKVVRELEKRMVDSNLQTKHPELYFAEAYAGGLRLMDELVGYERAFIIDAMVTPDGRPGTIRCLSISDLICTRNLVCAHDTNLATALKMGKMLGLQLPSEIRIWGIEAKDVETFGEELTEDVEKAVHIVVGKAMHEAIGKRGLCSEKCLEN